MVKRKYTELERELYKNLAKIYSVHNKMKEIFRTNIFNYVRQDKKEMDKWVRKIVDNLVDLEFALEKTKIPKKFLILNSLEDKND